MTRRSAALGLAGAAILVAVAAAGAAGGQREVTVARAPVIAAAGDISCEPGDTTNPCKQRETSDLLVSGGYDAVLALGDIQYERGTLAAFRTAYDPTWGRVKSITRPAVGNHEYGTPNAARLLRLLRPGGRPSRAGVVLLRPRRVARRRAQLELRTRRWVWARIATGQVAARRPPRASGAMHARVLASPAVLVGRSRLRRSLSRLLEEAVRGRCGRRPRRARPRLRALRAADGDRLARPTARDPAVRRRHRRQGLSTRSRRSRRTASADPRRRSECCA